MKKKIWGFVFVLIAFNSYGQSDREAFQQYQQQQKQAFSNYVKSQEEAFQVYKQAYAKAFAEYKQGILKKWPEALVSSPKRWVAYSKDFDQRTSVDFDKGEVVIERKLSSGESISQITKQKQQLKQQLKALQRLNYATAFKKDPATVALEKTVTKKIPPAWRLTAPVPQKRVPILAPSATLTSAKVIVKPKQNVIQLRYKLKAKDATARVKAVLPAVMRQAQQQQIESALALAIIKNESSFNPLATSPIPAYGLMQIVPTSAGKDATKYLFGQPKVLAPSYLYTPHKNIQTGVAYLHILNYRYLKWIKDPASRRYCTIAAYNTGAGNVARSFIGRTNIRRAAKKINQMPPQQVYRHLIRHLPYDETRRYLKKVEESYQFYKTTL